VRFRAGLLWCLGWVRVWWPGPVSSWAGRYDARMTLLPTLWTADVVYTGMGNPVRDGGVVVSGGVVAAAGPATELRVNFPQAREVRGAG